MARACVLLAIASMRVSGHAQAQSTLGQVFGKYEAVYSGCFYMYRLGEHIFHVDAGSETNRGSGPTRKAVGP